MNPPYFLENENFYDNSQRQARPRNETNLTIPDDSYTIGELFNRYQQGNPIGQVRHGIEDNNLNNPLRYDSDFEDHTTPFEITYDTYRQHDFGIETPVQETPVQETSEQK